jgi:hypothetical protein
MTPFREQIKNYVDKNWMIPCEDGLVWVYYTSINTRQEVAKQSRATGKDWAAVFLDYPDATYGTLEGLYLVPASDLGRVKGGEFDATKYAERKMISSWYDKNDKNGNNPEVLAQKPEYNGLNDCAHFVTQSLGAGGIHVETTGVPTLFNSLRGLTDTKTLAKTVPADRAEDIINAGIMDVGDVIIYSKGKEHHHSVVYMGSGKIAMHTWANHPDHPTIHGDWEASATDDHPLVTLIHFGRDDAAISANSTLLGWWTVVWQGTTYYYYFNKSGGVAYTKRAPSKLNQPIQIAEGRGYWFQDASKLSLCWTETGSLEVFTVRVPFPDTHMEGSWNGIANQLVADKMT